MRRLGMIVILIALLFHGCASRSPIEHKSKGSIKSSRYTLSNGESFIYSYRETPYQDAKRLCKIHIKNGDYPMHGSYRDTLLKCMITIK